MSRDLYGFKPQSLPLLLIALGAPAAVRRDVVR